MPLDRNTRILFAGAVLVGLMIGLAYASVPLYTMLCRVTGLGGTTQRAAAAPAPSALAHVADRIMRITLDSNVDSSLPWDFKPVTRHAEVRVGVPMTLYYRAHNRSDHPITGTATYNVQPDKAGLYFSKVQCFCFERQTLKAGETVDMAVQFYIDPSIAEDRNSDDLKNITLSYTFFLAKPEESDKNSTQSSVKGAGKPTL